MNTHFRERESYVRIVELTPELRERIEQTIEHLISLLDDYDGDDSAEDDGTAEPVNGWPNQHERCGDRRTTNDMSCDDDREVDNADYEPWLGLTTSGAHGAPYDADVEINGDEQEPFCGWTEGIDQTNPNSRDTTRPQEWSFHSGFDGSGERIGCGLLREKVGKRATRKVAQSSVRAWRSWSGANL